MFRAIPVSSKLCFDKQVKRSWKIHQAKVSTFKSSLSQERPQKFDFLDHRLKKAALQQVRNLEVDRENQALVKKIKDIQTKGSKTAYHRTQSQLSEQKKKTLNEPYRKRELLRIVEQNQEFLKRLQSKRSAYNLRRMEQQRKMIEKNISLISQFPFKGYPQTHTSVNFWASSSKCEEGQQPPQELGFSFRGKRKVDGHEYTVTTYLAKGCFYLEMEAAEDRSQRYRMLLPQQRAKDLLRISYRGRIENMVESLWLDTDKGLCFLRYSPAADA